MKTSYNSRAPIAACLTLLFTLATTDVSRAQYPPADGTVLWHTYQGGDYRTTGNNHDVANGMAIDAIGNIYLVGTSVTAWDTPLTPVNPHTAVTDDEPYVFLQDAFVAKLDPSGNLIWHTFLGTPKSWSADYPAGWIGIDEGNDIALDGLGNVYVVGTSDSNWGSPLVSHTSAKGNDAFVAKLDALSGTLVWNTFAGGGNGDQGRGIIADASGNVFVVGGGWYTWGAPIRIHHGGYAGDAFVFKLNTAGVRQWNTFLGGTNMDLGEDIALDLSGNIYVTGQSAFTFTDGTWGPEPPSLPVDAAEGGDDGFVAKLSPSGALQWYGFYGGSDRDWGNGIDVDASGYVYIAGSSYATWGGSLTKSPLGAPSDAFAAKINAGSGALVWNAFMGGSYADWGRSVTVDGSGNVYLVGNDFGNYWGSSDVLVAELDGSGVTQWYAAVFSEPDEFSRYGTVEDGNAVALDPGGNVVVAGYGQGEWGSPLNPPSGPFSRDVFLAELMAGNAPPVSVAGPASGYRVDEGRAVVLDGTDSFDYETPTALLQFDWDFDFDGIFGETGAAAFYGDEVGPNPEFLARDIDGAAHLEVILRVIDEGYNADESTVDIWIDNVAPELGDISCITASPVPGLPVSFEAGFSDPGTQDTHHARWDWGDGSTCDTEADPPPADCVVIESGGSGSTAASHSYSQEGDYSITLRMKDQNKNSDVETSFLVHVGIANAPPTAAAGGPYYVDEGATIALDGSGSSDPDGDPLTYRWDLDGDGVFGETGVSAERGDETGPTPAYDAGSDDGPKDVTISLEVDDGNSTDIDETTVQVANVAPVLGAITAIPDVAPLTDPIGFSADFVDPGQADSHAAVWDWGDSGQCDTAVGPSSAPYEACDVVNGTVSGAHAYQMPGVYVVRVSVSDDNGGVSNEVLYEFVVVYDPAAGFVTGGGWINSPPGACPVLCEDASGRANFGFVSKYKKGKTEPDGNTEFNFSAGGLSFHSSSYEWLVIAGPQAKFKGVGVINGAGDYGFMLSASDGDLLGGDAADKFRIKIWDRDAGDLVVYDNQPGDEDDAELTTAIGGGQIVIHSEKGSKAGMDAIADADGKAVELPESYELYGNYPNPFNPETKIAFALPESGRISLIVYDMLGRQVKVLVDGSVPAGVHTVEFRAGDIPSDVYLYRLDTAGGSFTGTMLLLK